MNGELKKMESLKFLLLLLSLIVTLSINAQTANDDYVSMFVGDTRFIRVLDNDVLSSDSTLNIVPGKGPLYGTVTIMSDTIEYVSTVSTYRDSFQYVVGSGANTSKAWVHISLSDKPDNVDKFSCGVSPRATDFNILRKAGSYTNLYTSQVPLVGLMGRKTPSILVETTNQDQLVLFAGSDINTPTATINIIKGKQFCLYGKAIADVDDDSVAEIFAVTQDVSKSPAQFFLTAYKYDMSLKRYVPMPGWNSTGTPGVASLGLNERYTSRGSFYQLVYPVPHVVDMNGDGHAEIVVYNRVYDAATGNLIASGSISDFANSSGGQGAYQYVNVAIGDVDSDGVQDIVNGNMLYSVKINDRNNYSANSVTLLKTIKIPGLSTNGGGNTALADIDGDGHLEAIVNMRTTIDWVNGQLCPFYFYIWDTKTGAVKHTQNLGTCAMGVSAFTVADLNGDGRPGIVFMAPIDPKTNNNDRYNTRGTIFEYYWDPLTNSLKEGFRLLTTDKSQSTTISAFDFNMDGKMEIIYRGETQLRVFDGSGSTPIQMALDPNGESNTASEYPVVADIDGDGFAEILTVDDPAFIGPPYKAYLAVCRSKTPGSWSSARKVWNQYNYNALTINENMSVPAHPASRLLRMPNGEQSYNSSLQQVPYVDSNGNPAIAAADIELNAVKHVLNPTGDSVIYTLTVANVSANAAYLASDSAVAFYCGDATGTLLWVGPLPDIDQQDTITQVVTVPLSQVTSCSDLVYIQVNDKGMGMGASGGMQEECNEDSKNSLWVSMMTINDDYYSVKVNTEQALPVLDNDSVTAGTKINKLYSSNLRLGTAAINPSSDSVLFYAGSTLGVDSFRYVAGAGANAYGTAWVYTVVTDNDTTTIDPTNKESIGANHFVWNVRDLNNLNPAVSKDTAEVTAFSLDGMPIIRDSLDVNTSQLLTIKAQKNTTVLPLSFYTHKGTSVEINAILMDNDSIYIDPISREVIGANNFIWPVKKAPSLTSFLAKSSAKVNAYTFDGTSIPQSLINVDPTNLNSIQNETKATVHPLKFTTPNGTPVSINVTMLLNDTIVPGPGGSSIGADYVVWKLKDLNSYTQAIAPDTAHVTAYDKQGKAVPPGFISTDNTKYNYLINTAAVGVYPMTYISPDTFVTANVLIFDNDTITPSPPNSEAIGANHFVWRIKDLPSFNQYIAKDTSHVTAMKYDGTIIDTSLIAVDGSQVSAIKAQTSPVQMHLGFSTPLGTTVTVKVNLLDNDTVVPGPNGEAIGADHILWQLHNLAALTKPVAKDTAHVTAFDSTGASVNRSNISVDDAQFDYMHQQASIGSYPLTFRMQDSTGVTVPVIVMDNDTITTDTTKQEIIGANNFIWKLKEVTQLTAQKSKVAARVAAYDFKGNVIPRATIKVDPTLLSAITSSMVVGKFPLSFTTPKGTSVQINVTLVYNDTTTIDTTNRESIGADNFLWQRDSLGSLTKIISKDTAHVTAYDSLGVLIPRSAIIVDATEYDYIISKDTVGVYPLSFNTAKGSRVTIHVVITDNDSTTIDPDEKQSIGADNVLWNIRNLSRYTKPVAKDTAHVTAFNFNGSYIPRSSVTLDQQEYDAIKAQTTPDRLPLTYFTPDGVSVSANVTLLDNDTVVPGPHGSGIGADNVVWKLKNLGSYTQAIAPDTAHVVAYDQHGNRVPRSFITTDITQFNYIHTMAAKGAYPMTYLSPDTFVTAHVFLFDNDTVVPGPNGEAIGADHILWQLHNLAALTKPVAKDTAHVTAFDSTGASVSRSNISVDDAQFNYMHQQASIGSYPLTFRMQDSTGVTVPVIVMDNDTITTDTTKQEIIGANNFIWKLKDVTQLTAQKSKVAARVAAYDFKGNVIPRATIKVDPTLLSAITSSMVVGKFPLSFTTPKGSSVQITVTLVYNDTTTIDTTNRESIGADNFLWQRDSLPSFTKTISKDTAHVTAYDSLGVSIPRSAIIVDATEYDYIISKDTVGVYPLSFNTAKGSRVTIHVVITDNDSTTIDPDEKQSIGADNVLWNIRNLSSYTKPVAKDTAHVTAFNFNGSYIPQSSVTLDQQEYDAIKAQTTPDRLPLTYFTPDGVSVSANVTLLDNDTVVPGPHGSGIGADNVVWKLKNLGSYTQAIAPDTAHVVAYDQHGNRVLRSSITTDITQFNYIHTMAAKGAYPMTYLSPDTFVTAHLLLFDNDTIVPNTDEAIGANNFVWKIKDLPTFNQYIAKDTSHVTAMKYDGTIIDTSLIAVDGSQVSAIKAQTSPVQMHLGFSTPLGTKVTVKVNLLDNDTVVPGPNGEAIGADHILWQLHNLAALTKPVAKDTAHVTAFDSTGAFVPRSNISVDDAQFNYMHQQASIGSYPLTFRMQDSTGVTVPVIVMDNDTITTDTTKQEIIGANNFIWKLKEATQLTAQKSKVAARVAAYDFKGNVIPRATIKVDPTLLSAITSSMVVGKFPLSFTTPKGTSVQINVTLVYNDTTTIDTTNRESIGADNFLWQRDSLPSFTKIISKDTAHVTAYDSLGVLIPRSAIIVDATEYDYMIGKDTVGVYPLSFNTPKGSRVTIHVVITDNDSTTIDPDEKQSIGADNVLWNIRNLSRYTKPVAKDTAHVTAFNFDGSYIPRSSVTLDQQEYNAIIAQTTPDRLPLTYFTPDGVSVSANVTLLDNDTVVPGPHGSGIGADNVVWKLKNLGSYTQAIAPDTAHVVAYDQHGNRVPRSFITTDITQFNYIHTMAAKGAYPMTYLSPDTFVTAHLLLFNNDTIVPNTDEAIGANNFVWKIKDLPTFNQYIAKDTSHVTAMKYDGTIIDTSLIAVDGTQVSAIKAQTSPVQMHLGFSTPLGTTVTVKVNLLDNDTVVPGPNGEAIGADHILWQLHNLAALTKPVAKDTAHVTAFDSTGASVNRSNISVDDAQFNYMHQQASIGSYPLTFRMQDSTGVTVPVIVMDNDTITTDTTKQEIIGANNFIWKLKEVTQLTAQKSKVAARVAAYDFKGNVIPRATIKVDPTLLSAITSSTVVGKFPLSFTTPKGTSVQINVTLVYNDTTTIDTTNRESIGADNFLWQRDSLPSLTKIISKDTAHVTAYDSLGVLIPRSAIVVDDWEYNYMIGKDTVGIFPLGFNTAKGTRVTIHVVVTDNDSTTIDPDEKQSIGADNVVWNIRNLSSYTQTVAKDTAHVTAFNFDGSYIPRSSVTLDQQEYNAIIAQTTPQAMSLTYITPDGVSVSASVLLLNDDTITPGPNDEAIGADHILWQLHNLAALTKPVAKDTAHVTAFDSTGLLVNRTKIKVDDAQFDYMQQQASIGSYPLTFRLQDSLGVTIPVIVMDNDTITTDTTNQEIIGANNFIWKLKEVTQLTAQKSKAAARVAAYDFKGNVIPSSTIKVDPTLLSAITSSTVVGKFPLSFTTPKGTSVQINVTLVYNDTTTIDTTNRESIGADNFLWQRDSLGSLTMDVSKDTAHVTAYDSLGVSIPRSAIIVDTVQYNYIIAKDTVGAYPLSFSTAKGSRVTIHVIVSNNDTTTIDPDEKQSIGADNVVWNIRNLNNYTKPVAKDTAHVTAFNFDGSSIPRSSVTLDQPEYNAILGKSSPAVLPLTYSTPDGVSVSANVILLNNDTIAPNPTKKEVIGADNFVWYLENLNALQAKDAKDTAHVTAFAYDGTPIDRNIITVNSTQLNFIQHQTQEAVEPLNYSTPNLTTVGVHVTLVSDSGSYNPTCGEYIIGKDISWSVDSIAFLDSATIRTEGKIRGIYTDGTGIAIDPSRIYLNSNDVAAVQGITTADSTVVVHFYTACGTLDSLHIISRASSVPNSGFIVTLEVEALQMELCNSTCEVDLPYTMPAQWGVDTMKRHVIVTITLPGTRTANAAIGFEEHGGIAGLYTSSVPNGGQVALQLKGNACVGSITIDRDSIQTPNALGYLLIHVTVGGKTQTLKLRFSGDFDQDGIPNAMERNTCIKKYNGIPNEWYYDDPYGDRDGDGIANIVEAHGSMDSLYLINSDNDCIPDFQDVDSNNDGVPDSQEKYTDNSTDTTRGGIHVRPAISPNGDNLGDDRMFIENINKYPVNTVVLFDRVGHIIYKANNYNNKEVSFDGHPNTGSYSSSKVPLGTYYYYVTYFDGKTKTNKQESGFVEIRY